MIDIILKYTGIFGLVFFFSTFILVAIWTYIPKRKNIVESHKYIPLEERDHEFK